MSPPPEYPFLYRWSHLRGVYAIGEAFDSGGRLLRNADLCHYFSDVPSRDEFARKLRALNGSFAVAIDRRDLQAGAVDRLRSFPMLYTRESGGWKWMDQKAVTEGRQWDETAASWLRMMWCTPEEHTLHPDIQVLQAGQFLWQGEAATYYYRHRADQRVGIGEPELAGEARDVFDRMTQRMIRRLDGRTALIPLSGGYDSRLVLTLLHRAGYPHIVTFTYGRPDSHEARIAADVTRQLDVTGYFIPYTRALLQRFFTDEWTSYSDRNHWGSGLPHEQDFFALSAMKEQGKLPEDFVAIPGFCGDLLGGSLTGIGHTGSGPAGMRKLVSARHFHGRDPGKLEHLPVSGRRDALSDAYQDWFVRHKVARFIVNSVRVYEHFGGGWMLPLWDNELTDFWYSVPYAMRRRQSLYNRVVFENYFIPAGVAMVKPGFDSNHPPIWRTRLRSVLPSGVLSHWRRRSVASLKADPCGLEMLTRLLRGRLKDDTGNIRGINDAHAIYFLQSLKK